ncbi:MAG: hypothetical protein PHS98_04990 [Bacilli bacterium]|nr:hypothetical protein [Bacilli bacterium]
MISVTRLQFLEMFKLKVLDGTCRDKNSKSWNVTQKSKKGKNKKRRVSPEDYQKYLFKKENENIY